MRFRGVLIALVAATAMLACASAQAAIKYERSWKTSKEQGGVDAVLALGNGKSLAAITFGGVVEDTPHGQKTFLPFEDKSGSHTYVEDMASGPDGTLYFVEQGGVVARYRQNGKLITSWQLRDSAYPDIDVSPDGTVYVLTQGPFRLARFGPNGKKLGQWKLSAKRKKALRFSSSLAIDGDGTVLIGNDWNGTVRRFTPDGSHIGLLARPGWKPGQTFGPASLATDKAGHIFVFDWYLNRLQTFTSDGEFVGQFGRTGFGNQNFLSGQHVSAGPGGQVVADDSGVVRQYRLTADPQPGYPAVAGWTLDWNRSARPGREVKVPFTVVNYGAETARGVRYCLPKWSYRTLLFAARRCNGLGSLEAGQSKRFKVRVRAPRRDDPDFEAESSVDFEVYIRSKGAGFSEALGQIWPKLGRR